MRLLLDWGADPNVIQERTADCTDLEIAARAGNIDIVRLLLSL